MSSSASLLILLVAAVPARAERPGTSASDFLKIGVGARQAAMGEAAVGLADDASAAYWNPGGLGQLAQQELHFLHAQWFDGIKYEYAAYAHPLRSRGTVAGYLALLDYGRIDAYDEGGAATGRVTASDWLAGAAYGSPLWKDRFRAGGGIKLVREKLDTHSSQAFSLDVGGTALLWARPTYTVQLGASGRNLVGQQKFISESAPLPRIFSAGLGVKALQESLSVGLDAVAPRDEDLYVSFGTEYWLHPAVAMRVGYRSGRQEAGSGISAGVGFKLGRLHFDYAFSDFGALGLAHRAGVAWKFGGLEEDLYQKGRTLMRQGRHAEAILQFNRVLQMRPGDRRAMRAIRESRDRLGDTQETLKEP